MLFQYLDVDFGNPAVDLGASATVGIESLAAPDYFLRYPCNEGLISNNPAIRWEGPGPIPVGLQSLTIE